MKVFARSRHALAATALLLLHACALPPPTSAGDPVEGRRVALRVGCAGCHKADGSGAELWGEAGRYKLYSPNLTQRRALYSDAALKSLLREGRTHDGRRLIGMPFVMFQALSDREIRDITAWLRALPAVDRAGPPPIWMSDEVRRQFDAGTLLEEVEMRARPGVVAPAEPPREALALGRHLAITSCVECHAPTLDGWGPQDDAPSLVVSKAYSMAQFTRLMRTGITISGRPSKTGLMSQMAGERFTVMNDAELLALKTYLDSRR